MVLLLFMWLAVAEETSAIKDLYVAPPTIHDSTLGTIQPYLTSLLVSSAQTNSHWVERSKRADGVNVHDKHTIVLSQDTTCNYRFPLECAVENMHWVMVTDIFVSTHFATIVVKLYDEEAILIASASKSSYALEQCKDQTTTTTINQSGRSPTQITEKKPDKCVRLDPKILASDIKQVTTIMFASIHPIQ